MNNDQPFKIISDVRHQLAEAPFWCARSQSLYWVDIPACMVWRWQVATGKQTHWKFDKKVSAVFTTNTEELLLVLKDEVVFFNPLSSESRPLCDLDTDRPGNRANDAGIAPDGSLWVGTMDDAEADATGRLWRISPNGEKELLLEGVGISNTLAWDLSRQRFYFADSMERTIYWFPYPAFADTRDAAHVFITTESGAAPDGSALDSEGCLWNAHWDGGRVVRYSPDGNAISTIQLPLTRPTSCCFGGASSCTLFITTASIGVGDDALVAQPHAGKVLAVKTAVAASPGNEFAEVSEE